jgi:endonuclease YncB( thermonuclease family)
MQRLLVALAVGILALGGSQFSGAAVEAQTGVVASVYDGDTLTLTSGARVRLLQIDTPEIGSGECYSRAARTALLNLTPVGSRLTLQSDPTLNRVDRYGRILRYLKRGSTNVNLELVRRGAATPYFYRGDRGRYANQLMAAAMAAKTARRGLWGANPRTVLNPDRAIETGTCGPAPTSPPPPIEPVVPPPAPAPPPSPPAPGNCDPNYSGGCVPPYPPDVDCADIRALGIAPVRVTGSDPHRLDGDNDGYGCE